MTDLEHSFSGVASVSEDSCGMPPPEIIEINGQGSELQFSEAEETLVSRMFNLAGERWSLIAGRIPGRTAQEIEKYWNTRYSTSE